MRWAPALSGVAAALFLAVLATDLATRAEDGGSAIGGQSLTAADRAQPEAANDYAADAATTAAGGPAGAIAPEAPTAGGEDDGAARSEALAPQATCTALRSIKSATEGERDYYTSNCGPAESLAFGDDADDTNGAATQPAELQATRNATPGDDGGNRTGFFVVEIVAAILAVGAAVVFFATRRRTEDSRPRPS
jgi:hypothetical protein